MEEEEEEKEQIIKKLNDIWENELKESFSNFMNQKEEEMLNGLEKGLNEIDDSVKNYIKALDKKLDEKKNINKNYEDDKILRKKVIDFQNLKKSNLVCLSLLQNTNPLINIILQCLSNIEYLAMYYLNPAKEEKILKKSKDNPNNTYLGPSFLTLLDHLWKSQYKEYAPLEIHNVLKKLMMNNYNTNDVSIIINFILNKLSDELNLNPSKNYNIENYNPYDIYDGGKIMEKFIDKFLANKTQISDTFFSSIKIKKKCLNCNAKNEYYYETTPYINLYLEENKNNGDSSQLLSLEENFNILLNDKSQEYGVENCINCKGIQQKFIKKSFSSTSGVLILVINIDKDPNNTIYFKYPEKFDAKEKINKKMIKSQNYELRSVIKKNNNNNNNFEYTAFYKNCIDNNWYLYNNQTIMLIQNDYKYYVFDEKKAYVLIYNQIKN